MSATLAPVEASAITTGNQLFRCVPYNCALLARSCVTRQAQADSAFPPAHLLLCKDCELGREVKRRALDVEVDPHAAARASRKHMPGVPLRAPRASRVSLPIIGLKFEAPVPAELPLAFTTTRPTAASATTPANERGPMPRHIELEIGKEIAGVRILAQLPSQGEGTLARVGFPCGHEDTVLAFVLNACWKNGKVRHCKVCRAARKIPATDAKPSPATRAKAPKSAPRKGPQERPALPAPALSGPTESKSYEFPLRRGFGVTVTLPIDLTTTDVHRFTRWLETLVFDDAPAAAE